MLLGIIEFLDLNWDHVYLNSALFAPMYKL